MWCFQGTRQGQGGRGEDKLAKVVDGGNIELGAMTTGSPVPRGERQEAERLVPEYRVPNSDQRTEDGLRKTSPCWMVGDEVDDD